MALSFAVGTLLYYNWLMWRDYIDVILWAFLISEALQGKKKALFMKLPNRPKSLQSGADDHPPRTSRQSIAFVVSVCKAITKSVRDVYDRRPNAFFGALSVLWGVGIWVQTKYPKIIPISAVFVVIALLIAIISEIVLQKIKLFAGATKRSLRKILKRLYSSCVEAWNRSPDRSIDSSSDSSGESPSWLVDNSPLVLFLVLAVSALADILGTNLYVIAAPSLLLLLGLHACSGWFADKVLSVLKYFKVDQKAAVSMAVWLGALSMCFLILSIIATLALWDAVSGLSAVYAVAQNKIFNNREFKGMVANATNNVAQSAISSMGTAFDHVKADYNETRWWPIAETVYGGIANASGAGGIVNSTFVTADSIFSNETWWPYVDQAFHVYHSGDGPLRHIDLRSLSVNDARRFASELYSRVDAIAETLTLDPEQLQEYTRQTAVWLQGNVQAVISSAAAVAGSIWGVLKAAQGSLLWVFFLFYFINLLLSSERSHLDMLCSLILPGLERRPTSGRRGRDDSKANAVGPDADSGAPQEQGIQDRPPRGKSISERFRSRLEAVVWMPIDIACLNTAFTLLVFIVLDLKFRYLAAVLAMFLSFARFLQNSSFLLFVVPWMIGCLVFGFWTELGFRRMAVKAALLFLSHQFGYAAINNTVLAQRSKTRNESLLTDFARGLGMYIFGIKGIFLGPLLTSLLSMLVTELLDEPGVE